MCIGKICSAVVPHGNITKTSGSGASASRHQLSVMKGSVLLLFPSRATNICIRLTIPVTSAHRCVGRVSELFAHCTMNNIAATATIFATIIREIPPGGSSYTATFFSHSELLLNYIYIPYGRARETSAQNRASTLIIQIAPYNAFVPFFCRGCSASALDIIGPVFFTSHLPTLREPSVYLYPVAAALTLNSPHRFALLRSAPHYVRLSRPPANLMTPRIIVRLLTGEKWPFTYGRI